MGGRDEYADMLRRQMGREVFCVEWLERAHRMGKELERSVDRHALVELLEQIADEVSHYAVLADLAEWLVGRKLSAEEAREYEVYAAIDPALPLERQPAPARSEPHARRAPSLPHGVSLGL